MDELEKIYGTGGNSLTEQQLRTGIVQSPSLDLVRGIAESENTNEMPNAKEYKSIRPNVVSTYDALPINAVDTFGVKPIIAGNNILINPASIPITFEYIVNVPLGRTYVLRKFYFVPTRYIYDSFNNSIADLFTITFFVNDVPVSENSGLIFPTWGTGGYVDSFFIAPEATQVKMVATITDTAYVDIEPAFDMYIGASISMQFNALLSTGEPPQLQIANVAESNNVLNKSETVTLKGMAQPARMTYKRP